jgi:hypothetical protein
MRRLLPEGDIAAGLYGTVLVGSVLVGLADEEESAEEVIAAVVVTAFVFALAHAWAIGLAQSSALGSPFGMRVWAAGIRHEWPMVQAAFPASAALFLATVGVYSVETGVDVAFWLNVAVLFGWAAILRRSTGGTLSQALRAGLGGAALGLLLVLLKVVVH